ncbi:MAG: type II toxin-antitoxin system prevent-host-death family antitoxin [Gemmatimonadota bacterium]
MAKSTKSIVGSRELKTRLGAYLRRVRDGDVILVTDRSEPIAELRPIAGSADPALAALRKAAAAGLVTLPRQRAVARFAAIASRGRTASSAVLSDRDDRW